MFRLGAVAYGSAPLRPSVQFNRQSDGGGDVRSVFSYYFSNVFINTTLRLDLRTGLTINLNLLRNQNTRFENPELLSTSLPWE